MTPERWQEVKKVLSAALERKPAERTFYLDLACTDPLLRREVESLIVAYEEGHASFIKEPTITSAPLQKGMQLGQYSILAKIGVGGMGEVYRAHDIKLNRDVAIKILPPAFVSDPERLARFRREARLLASLNHPNIASIHGLEESDKIHALVMELAEGPTLADCVARGPISIEEALPIAKQMAEALEYAHEHGIIHRDLKPANVKVAVDDTVKILDFGLAKALVDDADSDEAANSPVISQTVTGATVLLGTAAYMSPEQAKGKLVDRRADIWAFGCVLYEMLTGRRAFHGEAITDTLAALLKNEPDWSRLPSATPMRVRVLLQRCLQKDPKQRLRDIGDARISLEEVLSGATEGAPFSSPTAHPDRRRWPWLVSGVAGLLLLSVALLTFLYVRQKAPTSEAMRFEVSLPQNSTLGGQFALSPDGRYLALIAADTNRQTRVWVRSLKSLKARALEGTEGAIGFPFWSPDSHYIAFVAQGKLMKVESSGGPPLTLCDASAGYGGAWSRAGMIVLGSPGGILEVASSGGKPTRITDVPSYLPSFLPDGHHFVYSREAVRGVSDAGIFLGSVDKRSQEQSSKRLLPDESMAVFAPYSDAVVGYLLFVRAATPDSSVGTLMAEPFDTRRLELTGEAVSVAEGIPVSGFSVSDSDILAYSRGIPSVAPGGASGNIQGQLTWFDREGDVLGRFGDPGVYRSLALSPDGKRVAFERGDLLNPLRRNIWLYDVERGVATRFTFGLAWDSNPVWNADSDRIAFTSNRTGEFDVYQKAANLDGQSELLLKSSGVNIPSSWSPDGRYLLYYSVLPSVRVWMLPIGNKAADRKGVLLEHSDFNEAAARFSPDGRWIAYSSNESGKDQIYVRSFKTISARGPLSGGATPVKGKWMVSKDGGNTPLWRRDGKELFYLSPNGFAMAVDVSASHVFQAGIPKALFKVPPGVFFWDVSSDGKRFLMASPSGADAATPFTVVLNWQSDLRE